MIDKKDLAGNHLIDAFAFANNDQTIILTGLESAGRLVGITELSKQTNLDRTHLYRALKPDGNPTLSTFLKVLSSLNLSIRVVKND